MPHAWQFYGENQRVFTDIQMNQQLDIKSPKQPTLFSLIGPSNFGTQFFTFIPWTYFDQNDLLSIQFRDVVLGNGLPTLMIRLKISPPNFVVPDNLVDAQKKHFFKENPLLLVVDKL